MPFVVKDYKVISDFINDHNLTLMHTEVGIVTKYSNVKICQESDFI